MPFTNPAPPRASLPVALCLLGLPLLAALALAADQAKRDQPPVSFNKDIRPILSEKCIFCHGPDPEVRGGDLRLDSFEGATALREGKPAIAPGDLENSEFWKRIVSESADYRMPPANSHKELEAEEIEKLKLWIESGAQWEDHWAYLPVKEKPLPSIRSADWPLNEVDAFVLNAVESAGHTPSPPADKATLIRRVTFDLTGLPPTRDEVKSFLADSSGTAFETVVDRLLASPRFGERMATYWLDLVRYADTIGYHSDNPMAVAPYRSYVIEAFNENKPFDAFTREQLAGDLLDRPTREQLVASAYNQLNQKTEEGGAQEKEYLAIYQADRVRNVSSVFLGSTLACAQCHDHKYDPLTAKDFYSMGAFFADVETKGVYASNDHGPYLSLYDEIQEKRLARLGQKLAEALEGLAAESPELHAARARWEAESLVQLDAKATSETLWLEDSPLREGAELEGEPETVEAPAGPAFGGAFSRKQVAEEHASHGLVQLDATVSDGDVFFAYVFLDPNSPPQQVGFEAQIKGKWQRRAYWGTSPWTEGRGDSAYWRNQGDLPEVGKWARLEVPVERFEIEHDDVIEAIRFHQYGGEAYWDTSGVQHLQLELSNKVVAALRKEAEERSEEENQLIDEAFRARTPLLAELREQRDAATREIESIEETTPKVLATRAVQPREVRLLPRGNWMDESGPVMQPAIPEIFGALDTGERRANRLDLADWIVSEENPLTARVFVNRLWMLFFGRGISGSVEDFGNQGVYPSNPELLDHLAQYFMDSGWNVKEAIRHIVTSQTYRQSSKPSPELRENDPYNLLFARQHRGRLDAEMIRDNALALSGLLVEDVAGSTAKPYQPDGYYAQLNFPKREYESDTDPNQYRRGVYMHWQRTFLHPMLKAFDAPSREECVAQRSASNTPLQSLVLLNDPTFVEAARVYAERIIQQGGADPASRIRWAYETALAQVPDEEIVAILTELFDQHLVRYSEQPEEAVKLLSVGLAPRNEAIDTAELAAMTSVARVIFNLHETITRY